MNFPKDSRVVVIDNEPKEVIYLIRALSRHGISVTYLSGKKEELPEKPFSDVRMIFLDLVLEGVPLGDNKSIVSTLISVLSRIVEKGRSGPFILAIWTKHPEKIKKVQRALIKESYQPFAIDLQKDEFFDFEGEQKLEDSEMFKKIEKKIQDKLQNIGIFDILLLWENLVHNSSATIVNEFSKLIISDGKWDAEKWDKEMKNIFHKLAEAKAGKTLNTNSSQEVLKHALFTFDGIFLDTLEKNIYKEQYNQMDFSFLQNGVGKDIKGKINSRLLLDTSELDKLYPGNVYKIDEKDHINDNLTCSDTEIEEIKNESIPVIIEVSPLCDFAQNKMKLSRIVKGFLCPIEVQIDGTTIQICKKKLKNSAYFHYISPVIEYNEKFYRLVIDFRHFSAKSIAEMNENTPIFRLRKDTLIYIQTKLSSHINRPGVLFVE